MNTVSFKVKLSQGEEFDIDMIDDVTEIALTELFITDIDISPISACKGLEQLHLSSNHLTELNLAPLSKCPKLQLLGLYGNQLTNLDLSPLSECSEFQGLDLSDNQISTLDISPLTNCSKFKYFYLTNNPIDRLDVSAFFSHPNLEVLELDSTLELIADAALEGSIPDSVLSNFADRISYK
ncbi:MAG: leucine-rich repeat protein [Candidatus Lokiarchaeota archaeon]|nr:leucine-rich repeat protein [Candidatus Lokiarchaeota archaeon]